MELFKRDKVHQKYLLPPQNPFFTLVYNHLASHLPIALGEFKMNVLFFSRKSIDSTVFDVVVLSQNLSICCNQYKIQLSHMMSMNDICVGNKGQQPGYYFVFANMCLFLLQFGKDNEIHLALFWLLFNQGASPFMTQWDLKRGDLTLQLCPCQSRIRKTIWRNSFRFQLANTLLLNERKQRYSSNKNEKQSQ